MSNAQLLTKEKALALAVSITKKGVALRADIQKLAVTAIGYANVHGDTSVAIRALEAVVSTKLMPKKFIAYCEHYGKLTYDKSAKSFVFNREHKTAKTDPVELIQFLDKQPAWFEFDNSEEKPAVELIAKVEKLVSHVKAESLTPEEVALVEAIRKATEAYKLAKAKRAEEVALQAMPAAA